MMQWLLLCMTLAVDPYQAYNAGQYQEALQGFLDLQLSQPNDGQLQLAIGSAYYRLGQFAEASKAFERARSLSQDRQQLAKALYDLGNASFQSGKLEQAIEAYKAALKEAPHDDDSQANLKYVEQELKKRLEQAQPPQPSDEDSQKNPQEKNDQEKQQPDPKQPQNSSEQEDKQQPSTDAQQQPQPKDDNASSSPQQQKQADENKSPPSGTEHQPSDKQASSSPQNASEKPTQAQQGNAKMQEELAQQQAEKFLQQLTETRPKHQPQHTSPTSAFQKDW